MQAPDRSRRATSRTTGVVAGAAATVMGWLARTARRLALGCILAVLVAMTVRLVAEVWP